MPKTPPHTAACRARVPLADRSAWTGFDQVRSGVLGQAVGGLVAS